MLKIGDQGGLKVYADDLVDAARSHDFKKSLFSVSRWSQHHVLKDRTQAAPPGIIPLVAVSESAFGNTEWYFELCEDLNIKAANVGSIIKNMSINPRDMEGKMPKNLQNVLENVFGTKFIDRITINKII